MPTRPITSWMLLIGCSVLLASCGSASPNAAHPSVPRAQHDFASLPTGSPSSDYWIAGRLPRGYDLVVAYADSERHGYGSAYSTDYTHERSNSPLTVASSSTPIPTTGGQATTVRGHRAVLLTLRDDGRDYGVSLTWEERPGLTIVVSALEGLTVADARLVAAHVRPISPDVGRRLVTATDDIEGRVEPGMPRTGAVTGLIGGHRWTLTALLPTGYPVLHAIDRRAACYELSYRGRRSNGSACWGHPSWVRLAGQVFVFGEASPAVRRVVVRSVGRADVTVDAHRIARWAAARFWVTPMPTSTCEVRIDPVDHAAASDVHTLGQVGPFDQPPDHIRCGGKSEPPPGTAPPKPGGVSVPEVSATTAPAPGVSVPTRATGPITTTTR